VVAKFLAGKAKNALYAIECPSIRRSRPATIPRY
jgi:hypothetical protein